MLAKKLPPCVVLALALPFAALAADGAPPAKVALKSIGALEVGPENVLFVADSEGAAVYAFELTPPQAEGSGPIETIDDLDEKIAALLGTTARDVVVQDMAVHEGSGTVYLSITRGQGDGAVPVLMQVTRDGRVSEVGLDKLPHSKLDIGDAPAADAKWGRRVARTYTVTDLEFIAGELFIAGLSNEEFASTLRRAPYPFEDASPESTGLEIYHGAHGQYETHAPIFSFIPFDIEGKTHIVAGYLCTPLVTFPLSEIKSQKKLRGKTIAELGFGNIPTDILVYERDGEEYLLIVNTRRGTMKVKAEEIVAAHKRPGIVEEVGPRTGVEDHSLPIGHVFQAANFDAENVALLGRSMETGALYLATAPKRRL